MNAPSYNSTTLLVGFVVGVLILFAIGVMFKRDIRYMGGQSADGNSLVAEEEFDGEENIGKEGGIPAALAVQDQMSGMTVSVQSVEMDVPGWAVVHEIEGGHVLNALGAARLDAGVHDDLLVELLRATEPGGNYAVILYTDNGNKEFEIRGDLPVIDTDGNPVMRLFRTFGGAAGQ